MSGILLVIGGAVSAWSFVAIARSWVDFTLEHIYLDADELQKAWDASVWSKTHHKETRYE